MKKYIGRKVWLFPNDTYKKVVRITNVNEFGIEVEILESHKDNKRLKVGDIMFYPKGKLTFKLLD